MIDLETEEKQHEKVNEIIKDYVKPTYLSLSWHYEGQVVHY